MRILHFDQFEVLLPIGPLFLQGRRTVANFNPPGRAVRAKPGFLHVSEVFAAGDRTSAQSSVLNRLKKRPLAPGLTRARTRYRMLLPFYAASAASAG